MSYINKTHLPTANLDPAARLYAGLGWLNLVREALALTGDSIIMAIREDAGALRIELANSTPEQRAALVEISQRSLAVCEVCGEPGQLRYEGLNSGIPAGWHRTRCDQHIDTRTSSGLERSENEEDDRPAASFGDHFSHSEREMLILLCEKRTDVAASFFPEYGSARERSSLEDGLEQLLEMIQYDRGGAQ